MSGLFYAAPNLTLQSTDEKNREQVLSKHFIYLPHDIISQTMHQFDNLLLPTYLDLEEKLRKWDTYDQKPWPNLTEETPNASTQHLSDLVKDTNSIRPTACDAAGVLKSSVYRELLSAIRIRNSRIKKSESEKAEKAEEERLDQEALANGFIGECGCCFVEFPLHRMVQCNGLQEHVRTVESKFGH